jgi:hypothetical protein
MLVTLAACVSERDALIEQGFAPAYAEGYDDGCASSSETCPGWIRLGQRIMHGTLNAPSQLVFFSLRKGVIAPSGQVFMCGPLSVV